jgi:hypothetical protein
MSYEALGRPMPPNPIDRLKLGWAGVSTFLTAESAISRSTRLRRDWYAVLELAADTPIPVLRGRGQHLDLYADPEVLLAAVVEVLRCR